MFDFGLLLFCGEFFFFLLLKQESASASNGMRCTNSGMKENKQYYCKIHLQVLSSDESKCCCQI